mmetsp:Transcript_2342/g.6910  ORF Transcript_2342/g.6910 Transcript_2342/m.6910 type:complete len:81 (+) Transcript_2342:2460-2702(+)
MLGADCGRLRLEVCGARAPAVEGTFGLAAARAGGAGWTAEAASVLFTRCLIRSALLTRVEVCRCSELPFSPAAADALPEV